MSMGMVQMLTIGAQFLTIEAQFFMIRLNVSMVEEKKEIYHDLLVSHNIMYDE